MLLPNPPRPERSDVTFGPAGRVGVTVLLFVPVAFGMYFSLYFYAAAVVWMLALPIALHQIWQTQPVPARSAIEPALSGDTSRR